MSSGYTILKREAFVLGYTGQVATVSYRMCDGVRVDGYNPGMVIMDAGGVDEETYTPPSAITFQSAEAIRNLRDACNVALGE